jgi:hypothetical protein
MGTPDWFRCAQAGERPLSWKRRLGLKGVGSTRCFVRGALVFLGYFGRSGAGVGAIFGAGRKAATARRTPGRSAEIDAWELIERFRAATRRFERGRSQSIAFLSSRNSLIMSGS